MKHNKIRFTHENNKTVCLSPASLWKWYCVYIYAVVVVVVVDDVVAIIIIIIIIIAASAAAYNLADTKWTSLLKTRFLGWYCDLLSSSVMT